MSIRIYALAKQLKIESKSLVDVCNEIGLDGKGSALASLTDEEVEQVKGYLKGSDRPAPAEPESAPMIRPTTPVDRGRVPVMKTASRAESSAPEEDLSTEVEEAPAISITPTEGDVSEFDAPEVEIAASDETPSETPTISVTPTAPTGSFRREDYIGPGGARKEMRDLGQKRPKPKGDDGDETDRPTTKKTPTKKPPTIALAPMPAAPPPKKKKVDEPAAMKPEIKLPMDAIRAASKGKGRPLSEHLRMHEEKRQETQARKKGAAAKAATDATETPGKKKGPGKFGGAFSDRDGGDEKDGKRKRAEERSGSRRKKRQMDDDRPRSSYHQRRFRRSRSNVNTAAPRKSDIVIQLPCSVKDFAQETGLPVGKILGECMKLGLMLNINAMLDADTVDMLAETFSVSVDVREAVSLEDKLISAVDDIVDAPENLVGRPPIVTFLGHVDHGKTSLLDRIIGLNVVAGEKGGITQHIRAYRVHTSGGDVAFVDTPGHEAFTEMRARGANVTDIAVLVVAADDGVMPQTEEAISHIKAAGVPIVVALNKTDLPGVTADRALQDLAANELLPSEWGGDIEVVRTSAMTGDGVEELMETLLTVAELHELQANPDRDATGVCLEAELQPGRGVVAKMLVRSGTLKVGDVVVCGPAFGRVKAMYDTLDPHKKLDEAGPSTPVNLTGLDVAPGAGDRFHVLENISEAREIAESRAHAARSEELATAPTHVTLENLFDRIGGTDEVQTLNVILRADVRGSIEAIRKELGKLDHPEVQVKLLQTTVGGITEADVHLADASDAIIIGFSVVPDEGARVLADAKGVQIRRYDIIYKLTEDIRAALEGMLKPEEREAELGRALVQRVFKISRLGAVAGCRVLAGNIQRDARVRLIRENRVIGDYAIDTLKREKDDAKEVREGYECGIKLKGYNDIKEGDIFEAYKIEEVARTF